MRQAGIDFKSKKLSLEGIISTPDDVPGPYPCLIVCHPHPTLGGDMSNPVVMAICTSADQLGFATMRFNFRGVGSSEGSFTNGEQEHNDLKAAIGVMRHWQGMDSKRIAIAGYSFGAGIVLRGIKHYKAANSLVLVAPPLSSLQDSRVKKDKRPKLFLVGQNDKITPSVELQRELDEVRDPVQFHEIPNTDHSLRGHEQEIGDRTSQFVATMLV